MTLLGDAALSLNASLDFMAGIDVKVTRGATTAMPMRAIKGRARTERFAEDPAYITAKDDDFIFVSTEYQKSMGSLPEVQDIIEWVDDTNTVRRFQVGVDGVERQWDPVDQFGQLIRVHAIEVSV